MLEMFVDKPTKDSLRDNQFMPFNYDGLERKLGQRLSKALKRVNGIPQEDFLELSSEELAQIIEHFSIIPPLLQMDSMGADNKIIESVDMTFERKTGQTNHSFFIPIKNDFEWLEEVEEQETEFDGYPLAFLDKNRSRISIRLTLSPEDEEDALGDNLKRRLELVKQYADDVSEKTTHFNQDLAERVTSDFNQRRNALVKAIKALERAGLPLMHNPEHEERDLQMQKLMRRLSEGFTTMGQKSTENTLSVVLSAMNELAQGPEGLYVDEADVAQKTGFSLEDVRDYIAVLKQRGLIASSGSASCLTPTGRIRLKDSEFKIETPSIINNYNSGVQAVHHGTGDISGNIQNINSTLGNVVQTINESPHLKANKAELSELIRQLNLELQQVPPEREKEAKAFGEATKELIEKADKKDPDFFSLRITADGLKAAAKNLASVAPNVITTISKIVPIVLGTPTP